MSGVSGVRGEGVEALIEYTMEPSDSWSRREREREGGRKEERGRERERGGEGRGGGGG